MKLVHIYRRVSVGTRVVCSAVLVNLMELSGVPHCEIEFAPIEG
jgi:hypothetical protein